MSAGKAAAMAAHAAMTFILKRLRGRERPATFTGRIRADWELAFDAHKDEFQWLTELDPGIEETQQVSMAKIVLAAINEPHLLAIEQAAQDAGLEVHRVIDSGHTHNPKGTFVGLALGPDWPERLEPITGSLKVYR